MDGRASAYIHIDIHKQTHRHTCTGGSAVWPCLTPRADVHYTLPRLHVSMCRYCVCVMFMCICVHSADRGLVWVGGGIQNTTEHTSTKLHYTHIYKSPLFQRRWASYPLLHIPPCIYPHTSMYVCLRTVLGELLQDLFPLFSCACHGVERYVGHC